MIHSKIIPSIFFLLLVMSFTNCIQTVKHPSEYLLMVTDSSDASGYVDQKGKTIIPPGKYLRCFTDTFRTYAIVANDSGLVVIDRKEKVLYQVFNFDNGPDEPSDSLFRIVVNNKIGYADIISGKIIIEPRFECAWPFEDSVAQVSTDCKKISDGEHTSWESDHWFYIDKTGKKVATPESEK